jgi:hypothetical protein
MSDRVIGIAVLEKPEGRRQLLHILCDPCDHPGEKPFHHYIPVLPKESPEPNPTYVHWKYEVKGDRLHVTPSVRISTTRPKGEGTELVEIFHNEGAWSVAFQDHTNRAEFPHASDQFRMINGLQKYA